MNDLILISIAMALDMLLGDPKWFLHPVVVIGKLISILEKFLYAKKGKYRGFILLFLVCVTVYLLFELILYLSSLIGITPYVTVFFLYTSLSIKSLKQAGQDVKNALLKGVKEAREQLSMYVGRDTSSLDIQGIIRGTVETIAENTIDGVIAPIFFMLIGAIFSAPLQFVYVYKAVNTLDSMVGYNNEKYSDFGFFSAKTDDILNFIPARIGAFIMLLAGGLLQYDIKNGFKVFKNDRKKHKSPNAAHGESVIAGLLGITLGGNNIYFGKLIEKPYIGNKKRKLTYEDITSSNKILYTTTIIIGLGILLTGVLI